MKRKAARLLREMRVYVRPRRLKAEEAHGPPAERERLQWKATVYVHSLKKTVDNTRSFSSLSTVCKDVCFLKPMLQSVP
ncbi:hypothetical protein [Peribacillus muralis]|uniref:hypothetical protein n=1 Tax=Peribacillus muralis TaxID=264697 RepID=UPI003672C4A1